MRKFIGVAHRVALPGFPNAAGGVITIFGAQSE
jgi:hypothetical protein